MVSDSDVNWFSPPWQPGVGRRDSRRGRKKERMENRKGQNSFTIHYIFYQNKTYTTHLYDSPLFCTSSSFHFDSFLFSK